jgi:phosphoribosylanthranilate isomerase
VKVCGLTNPEDAAQAAAAGADFLGFVVHPQSPRHCGDLPEACKGHEARAVLVTVGEEAEPMMRLAESAGLRWIQPHASRPARKRVAARLRQAGFRVLLPWPDEADQEPVDADLYLWEPSPEATGVPGGSGQGHAAQFPPPGAYLLAGGLDGGNLRERIQGLPYLSMKGLRGVDAASRLERGPGLKDPDKVNAFLEAARAL